MTPARRRFLQLATGFAALPALAGLARAQSYPSRPVRLIVPLPAGSTPDIYARMIAERMADQLHQPIVVENRPGGSANIGTEFVIRAAPDGYTLVFVTAPNVINATLFPELKYNFIRDTVPVAAIGGSPFLMLVNPAFPANSVPEFIAYAKANPGKINIASSGIGNLTHMAAEMFKMMAGVDMLHVPYNQGETGALTDMLGDRVQAMFDPVPSSIGYVRAGKLRALAVTSPGRMDLLPELPPLAQYLPGYVVTGVTGISAPKGTPADVIATLNAAVNTALDDAKIKQRFAELGSTEVSGTPEDFGKIVAAETERWGKVIKFADIKAQ
jgi:tripartite-type tricarboxylate transporter receptor subunit TctC